jgi:hypothetical protein
MNTKQPTKAIALLTAIATTAVAHAETPPKMKMTTDIPEEITTPDKVETRVGTLNFKRKRGQVLYIRYSFGFF